MRLGILHTGDARPIFYAKHGDYARMFDNLLHSGGFDGETVHFRNLRDGEFPHSIDDADAWLITGSRSGVYEDLPWIPTLEELVREAQARRRTMVGICFGHQIMAQATGGKVIKSPKGWGIGVHRYAIHHDPPWMQSKREEIAIQVHHQDQVVELASGMRAFAGSDFCPNAALMFDDWGLSFQGHPEFTAEYAGDLIQARVLLDNGLTADEAAGALRAIHAPIDRELHARWIASFIAARA